MHLITYVSSRKARAQGRSITPANYNLSCDKGMALFNVLKDILQRIVKVFKVLEI